ncbi:hypothetical protein ES703_118422 [subsurface metagenome]
MSGNKIIDKILIASAGKGFFVCFVPASDLPEEFLARLICPKNNIYRSLRTFIAAETFMFRRIVKLVQQPSYAIAAYVDTEMVLGDVLNIMCLVDYHVFILRQQPEALLLEHKVTEHKRMISNNNISRFESAAGFSVKAVGEMFTLSRRAVASLAVDCLPYNRCRQKRYVT